MGEMIIRKKERNKKNEKDWPLVLSVMYIMVFAMTMKTDVKMKFHLNNVPKRSFLETNHDTMPLNKKGGNTKAADVRNSFGVKPEFI